MSIGSMHMVGVGSAVPEQVVSNDQIGAWAQVAPEWVVERTGIRERRYAASTQATSDLAHQAARMALADAGIGVEDLGAIIVATSTPDHPQPATAVLVQQQLGAVGVPSFDLNAVCAGFMYGLQVARGLLADMAPDRHVLLIGADTFSRIMDRSDRRTVSLFGDGAGAVVLGGRDEPGGFGSIRLVAHGDRSDLVRVQAGGSREPIDESAIRDGRHRFQMRGREVKDYAMRVLSDLTDDVLECDGLGVENIDRFIFHQANVRLLEGYAQGVGAPMARFALSAPLFGNTAAACVPLTLDLSRQDTPLRTGERLLLAAVGGGMTAGMATYTWNGAVSSR